MTDVNIFILFKKKHLNVEWDMVDTRLPPGHFFFFSWKWLGSLSPFRSNFLA